MQGRGGLANDLTQDETRLSQSVSTKNWTTSSNGIQLADLCAYNVYRAFRGMDFEYEFFQKILPYFYKSQRTSADRLDGLKIWPDDSELIDFARRGWTAFKAKQPTS